MTRHHSPPHGPDPEDEPTVPTVPTVHDLGFRPAVGPGRLLAVVVLTLVLCGLALWMCLANQAARVEAEDPTRSHD